MTTRERSRVSMRYNGSLTIGWVIRSELRPPVVRRAFATWWYGPDHGFGTTYGPLDSSVRVWPTRDGAEKAAREVYGSRWRSRMRRASAQRVVDATREAKEQRERREG